MTDRNPEYPKLCAARDAAGARYAAAVAEIHSATVALAAPVTP
jgi:hypothetical protein